MILQFFVSAGDNHWNKEKLILASGQLIFWLVETISFLHFSDTPTNDSFFPSSGKVFFSEILISACGNAF